MRGKIEPTPGEIEMNIEKLRKSEKPNFLFGWRGPLVMIFDRVGWGQEEGDRGQEFQIRDSQGPNQVGRGS